MPNPISEMYGENYYSYTAHPDMVIEPDGPQRSSGRDFIIREAPAPRRNVLNIQPRQDIRDVKSRIQDNENDDDVPELEYDVPELEYSDLPPPVDDRPNFQNRNYVNSIDSIGVVNTNPARGRINPPTFPGINPTAPTFPGINHISWNITGRSGVSYRPDLSMDQLPRRLLPMLVPRQFFVAPEYHESSVVQSRYSYAGRSLASRLGISASERMGRIERMVQIYRNIYQREINELMANTRNNSPHNLFHQDLEFTIPPEPSSLFPLLTAPTNSMVCDFASLYPSIMSFTPQEQQEERQRQQIINRIKRQILNILNGRDQPRSATRQRHRNRQRRRRLRQPLLLSSPPQQLLLMPPRQPLLLMPPQQQPLSLMPDGQLVHS